MQITLNQAEILTALEAYVRSQVNIAENHKAVIELKAGRVDGYTATLDIVPDGSVLPVKPIQIYREIPTEPAPVAPVTVAPAAAPVAVRKPFGLSKPVAASAPVEEAPAPQVETPDEDAEVTEASTTAADTDGENAIAMADLPEDAEAAEKEESPLPPPVKRSIFAKAGKL